MTTLRFKFGEVVNLEVAKVVVERNYLASGLEKHHRQLKLQIHC